MFNTITINRVKSPTSVASVAVRKDFNPDRLEMEKRLGTGKVEFSAFLCPSSGSQIPSLKGSILAAHFELDRASAPPEIFRKETTFERDLLNMSSFVGFVKFRFGKINGEAKADIINLNLTAGKYSWTDELLRTLAYEVGKNLQSMQISSVGGFAKLNNKIRDEMHAGPERRLMSVLKHEFKNLLPLSEKQFFEDGRRGKSHY